MLTNIYLFKILDINECNTNNGECEQDCNNTPGSRFCSCNTGYTLNSDQQNCDGKNSVYMYILTVCEISQPANL